MDGGEVLTVGVSMLLSGPNNHMSNFLGLRKDTPSCIQNRFHETVVVATLDDPWHDPVQYKLYNHHPSNPTLT